MSAQAVLNGGFRTSRTCQKGPGATVIRAPAPFPDSVRQLGPRDLWNHGRNRVTDPGLILPSKPGLNFAIASAQSGVPGERRCAVLLSGGTRAELSRRANCRQITLENRRDARAVSRPQGIELQAQQLERISLLAKVVVTVVVTILDTAEPE
jgi:hypothetical protein